MPSRYYQRTYLEGGYYHLYNRGTHKQTIFRDNDDYFTFTEILSYYLRFPHGKPHSRFSPKNEPDGSSSSESTPCHLLCYCLMPNHFHLLLKQILFPAQIDSPTNLMRRLSITYSMYFNDKYQHSGNLFQGKFKNVPVDSESQLLHLTKYIHRNPLALLAGSEPATLESYIYSSYSDYLGPTNRNWVKPNEILSYFSSKNPLLSYRAFIEEKEDLLSINHLILDD
ncbi:MAG: transposase [Patescibacteria group bacterium]